MTVFRILVSAPVRLKLDNITFFRISSVLDDVLGCCFPQTFKQLLRSVMESI